MQTLNHSRLAAAQAEAQAVGDGRGFTAPSPLTTAPILGGQAGNSARRQSHLNLVPKEKVKGITKLVQQKSISDSTARRNEVSMGPLEVMELESRVGFLQSYLGRGDGWICGNEGKLPWA